MSVIESRLSEYAAAIRFEDIPALASSRTLDAFADCMACAYAGARTDIAHALADAVIPFAPDGMRLIGTARRAASAPDAALYNATLSHALDYDDISHPAYSHPSAVLWPALLAIGEKCNATGRDAIAAYVLGLEVFGKLGRTLNTQHYRNGWHATSTFGSIAAAVACARLLGLDAPRIMNAIGIGASAASGFRVNFGTMTKPLHAGYAARNGAFAALLAASGYTASEDALTHAYGFCQTFNQGKGQNVEALAHWGESLEILSETGLALKPYPSCAATHTAIEAASLIRRQIAGDTSLVKSISVGLCQFATEPLIYQRPKTPLEAKFSAHFCAVAGLALDDVDLSTFTDERVQDAEINRLIGMTRVYVDDRVRDDHEFASVVGIETTDGRTLEELVWVPMGKPARWFSRERLQLKFADCCSSRLSDAESQRCITALSSLADAGTRIPAMMDSAASLFR
jgi:2-methylcitrate dehydratase PrpD